MSWTHNLLILSRCKREEEREFYLRLCLRREIPSREGMIESFSLGNHLLLVEYTGRLFREGKAVISGELTVIFERLGSNAENWQARLQKLAAGRLLGRFFAASRARLREVAERLGVHHLANMGGCAALALPRRLDSKLVSISLFQRRSQDSGDLVVSYLCRDRADHLWQFGMRSKPACRPRRTAVRGCMLIDTRKPGRPTCGLRKTCRLVGQERLAKACRSAARPGSPGVDLAGRGSGPTVVTRANVATLFPWVPDSGWPYRSQSRLDGKMRVKCPKKGVKW
ncbi:MAG: hypothetical protein ABSH35_11370 [Isosphaeraceae bacterium]